MAEFFKEYCGLSETGKCNCKKRIGYAIKTHRLNPKNIEYSRLDKLDDNDVLDFTNAMEEMDRLSSAFEQLPKYRATSDAKNFLEKLLSTNSMGIIKAGV